VDPISRLTRENLLWDREWRAAQRRWWNQPWFIPCLILVMIVPAALRGNLTGMRVRLDLMPWWEPEIPLTEIILWMWILWHLSVTMIRERAARTTSTIAVTLIDRRHVAIAKTFAPIYTALLVLMGLLLIRGLVMLAESTALGRDVEEEVLAGLSLEVWVRGILDGRLLHYRGWVRDSLVWLDYFGRALLFPICAVTIASFVAARHRVAWRAAATSALCILGALIALHALYALVLFPSLGMVELPDYWGRTITTRGWPEWFIFPAVFTDLAVHLLIPIAWLAWWWRWTRRGFGEVYFNEE